MDNDAMERKLRDLYSSGDLQTLTAQLSEMASDDMVQEWPQSGERIRGRDNVIAVNEHYEGATGTAPSMTLRRIVRPGQAWIVEGTIDYGDGTPVSIVSILETDDAGKLTRQRDYFASPFEAPEWRRKWVEQMEAVGAR
jgi:hypothetical protein